MWTNDSDAAGATYRGKYLYLTNKGRIAQSFLVLNFERHGNIVIDATPYIKDGTFAHFSSLDPMQITISDSNATSDPNHFWSQFQGNIFTGSRFLQGAGAPSTLAPGSIYMRNDADRGVALDPVYAGIGGSGTPAVPLAVARHVGQSFTPVLRGGSTAGTGTYSTQTGRYTRSATP